jgi:hypothetical protein
VTTRLPVYLASASTTARYAYYINIRNGDSASPALTIINGEVVALGTWRYGGAGGFNNCQNQTNRDMINTAMAPSGYSLTEIDLSSFPTYS